MKFVVAIICVVLCLSTQAQRDSPTNHEFYISKTKDTALIQQEGSISTYSIYIRDSLIPEYMEMDDSLLFFKKHEKYNDSTNIIKTLKTETRKTFLLEYDPSDSLIDYSKDLYFKIDTIVNTYKGKNDAIINNNYVVSFLYKNHTLHSFDYLREISWVLHDQEFIENANLRLWAIYYPMGNYSTLKKHLYYSEKMKLVYLQISFEYGQIYSTAEGNLNVTSTPKTINKLIPLAGLTK